jgi:hypothetical protein
MEHKDAAKDIFTNGDGKLEDFLNQPFLYFTGSELKALGLPKKPVAGVKIFLDCLVSTEEDATNGKYEARQVVFQFMDTYWAADYVTAPGASKRKVAPWDDDKEYVVTQFTVVCKPMSTDEIDNLANTKTPTTSASNRSRRPRSKSTVAAGLDAAA